MDRNHTVPASFVPLQTEHKGETVTVHAKGEIRLGKFSPGRIKEFGPVRFPQRVGQRLYEHGLPFQDAADIAGAEHILTGCPHARVAHADQGDLLRVPPADIGGNGSRVDQPAGNDLIGPRRVDDVPALVEWIMVLPVRSRRTASAGELP